MMRWLKNLFKKKKREPMYFEDEYLVQDWRGFVISQGEHRRIWGFNGYPATHATDCMCGRCQMVTRHYAEVTGYLRVTPTWPSRRLLFDYLRRYVFPYRQTVDYPWIKKEEDFLPKKKMKVHKLDQHIRKETFVSPGVYTREVDYSVIVLNRRNRDE